MFSQVQQTCARGRKGRKDHFHTFPKPLPENQLLPTQHFKTEAAVLFPWVFLLLAAWLLCSVQTAPDGRTLLCPRFSIAAFTKYDPVAPAVTFTMFSGKIENAIFPTWLRRLEIINSLTMASQREIISCSKYNKYSKCSNLLTFLSVLSLFYSSCWIRCRHNSTINANNHWNHCGISLDTCSYFCFGLLETT